MARKGSRKVRTGCLTCKIRKIKCDEGKPSCKRCTGTGRHCDGYTAAPDLPPVGALWYRPRTAFQGVDDAVELQSLQFFTEVLSPILAGPMDPYFWTHLVLQFSHFEPAVRHSLVAISSLYTQDTPAHTTRPQLTDNPFALHHYNAAIRELRVMKNEPLVLLVCVLFTCIEFLQGNAVAAGAHCKHGTIILNHVEHSYSWTRQYLSPIFRRINVIPFFFGQPNFPKMTRLDEPIPSEFLSLAEAQLHLDGIINRAIHLLRYGMIDRVVVLNYRTLPTPQHILNEQLDLMKRLQKWHISFAPLKSLAAESKSQARNICHMLVFAGIARVWIETTLKDDEMVYDKYIAIFRSLVEETAQIEVLEGLEDPCWADDLGKRPRFTFEMGFTPSIYFIVLKCRDLATRVRALSILRRLGVARENLWESAAIYSTGKRVIELEHGVMLGRDGMPFLERGWGAEGEVDWDKRPEKEKRILSTDSSPDLFMRADEETGQRIYERQGTFYYEKPGGGLDPLVEMLPELPRRFW